MAAPPSGDESLVAALRDNERGEADLRSDLPHRARTWARLIGQRETGIAALHITIVDIGFWRRRRPAIWHIGLHNAKMSHARRCSAPSFCNSKTMASRTSSSSSATRMISVIFGNLRNLKHGVDRDGFETLAAPDPCHLTRAGPARRSSPNADIYPERRSPMFRSWISLCPCLQVSTKVTVTHL